MHINKMRLPERNLVGAEVRDEFCFQKDIVYKEINTRTCSN